jgi:putative transposase
VTLCSKDRKPDLTAPTISGSILLGLRRLQTDGDYDLHCATSMPDHVHLLFTLKERLSLGQVVGKFKATTKAALQTQQLEWQQNYFDHRLREHIPMEDFARYIFLNPYNKGLTPYDQNWPMWILSRKYRPEFTELLIDGIYPPSEWKQWAQSASELVQSDSTSDEKQSEPT